MGRGEGKKGPAINDVSLDESQDHGDEDEAMLAQYMGAKVEKSGSEKKKEAPKKTKAEIRREEKTLWNCCKMYKQSLIIHLVFFIFFNIYIWGVLPTLHAQYQK